ncbi:Dde superfamily endonuclease [Plakobranchus ocellatus]|uniref:Dde superfamily endonuclease n=1 Tax=Plakobranchus ocellatus TaxID=259542 RepID=A0AAV4AC31_9GAST|nr:Dde superfamily endonuclease [Plakobranchus ocellatus]
MTNIERRKTELEKEKERRMMSTTTPMAVGKKKKKKEYESCLHNDKGINIWTKRTRGRAVRGRRAVRVVQGRRGPNLTMTFAVSNVGGLIYHELTEGGMTGKRFNEFIGTVCRLYHPLNACFVIDNAPAHRQAVNLPLPQNFSVRYLPPYSPFLNICENAFALWKGNIKDSLAEVRDQLLREDHQQRMATLVQLAEQGTAVVTLHRMQAAFRGMHAYLPACFGLDDILMKRRKKQNVRKKKEEAERQEKKEEAERQEKKEEAGRQAREKKEEAERQAREKKEEAERRERKEEADHKERLELEKMKLDAEMKLLQAKIEAGIIKNEPEGSGARSNDAGAKHPKLPNFQNGRDDLDIWLTSPTLLPSPPPSFLSSFLLTLLCSPTPHLPPHLTFSPLSRPHASAPSL